MIGDKIKTLRTSHGISQTALSKHLGVSKQSVSNWEHNNILPSMDLVIKLADYFSCSTDYILGRQDSLFIIETTDITEKQLAIISSMIEEFRALNKSQKS